MSILGCRDGTTAHHIKCPVKILDQLSPANVQDLLPNGVTLAKSDLHMHLAIFELIQHRAQLAHSRRDVVGTPSLEKRSC
jgi:hypothetical protein